jgi:hypothetical protein
MVVLLEGFIDPFGIGSAVDPSRSYIRYDPTVRDNY